MRLNMVSAFGFAVLLLICGCDGVGEAGNGSLPDAAIDSAAPDGGDANNDGDGDGDADGDAGMDGSTDAGEDSGPDCGEHINEEGRCVESLACYCEDEYGSKECSKFGTIDKASEWLGSTTGNERGICLFRCEGGGGYLALDSDPYYGDGYFYQYSHSSGELVGLYRYSDAAVYCNETSIDILYGEEPECSISCVEVVQSGGRPVSYYCEKDYPICKK